MSYVKKLFKYIAYFILGILVSLSLYTFFVTDILKNDYVDVFGYTYFVVKTGSMTGALEVDDVIFVKIGDKPDIGDIATYKSDEGEIITHRLVRKLGNKLIMQGDVNNSADKPIDSDMIIGVVKASVSPKFLIKSIAVFLIVFICLSLINFDFFVKKIIFKGKKIESEHDVDLKEFFNIKIPIAELDNFKRVKSIHSVNIVAEDIEILDFEETVDITDILVKQEDLLEQIINLLKIRNGDFLEININKQWILKYQFVYKLINILLTENTNKLVSSVNNIGFKELFDYDLEKVGLYESFRNKIYDLPIYEFLRILIFVNFYNDDKFFDGIYKIMKYKISIDKNNYFNLVKDNYGIEQLKFLMKFMKEIALKYDPVEGFGLRSIEAEVKLESK